MTFFSSDTIAAIATPPGVGGIAVIRISGPAARDVLGRVFASSQSKDRNFAFRPRFMHHGHALDAWGQAVDEVLAVFMPGPGTATGEDVGEIHCHGGRGVSAALLEAVLAAGARPAGPGEFSKRAFLNGRMDLTQAEAVAEIIAAPTREGARLAKAKLDGLLGGKIRELRAMLDHARMRIAAAVDFPDEDLDLLPREELAANMEKTLAAIDGLLQAYQRARLWREGALAVLAGCVNAGKSSLMNALLGRARAIVSPVPGTTRDYIEETIQVNGMPLRLADTAGIRAAEDAVEEEGIRLAHGLVHEADLILLVVDVEKGLTAEEAAFLDEHKAATQAGRVLILMNKLDKQPDAALPEVIENCRTLGVSAKEGLGLARLIQVMAETLHNSAAQDLATDLAPNLRQSKLLQQAAAELQALVDDIRADLPPDILSVRLETAAMHLDDVTGTSSSDEILGQVFSTFCIGK